MMADTPDPDPIHAATADDPALAASLARISADKLDARPHRLGDGTMVDAAEDARGSRPPHNDPEMVARSEVAGFIGSREMSRRAFLALTADGVAAYAAAVSGIIAATAAVVQLRRDTARERTRFLHIVPHILDNANQLTTLLDISLRVSDDEDLSNLVNALIDHNRGLAGRTHAMTTRGLAAYVSPNDPALGSRLFLQASRMFHVSGDPDDSLAALDALHVDELPAHDRVGYYIQRANVHFSSLSPASLRAGDALLAQEALREVRNLIGFDPMNAAPHTVRRLIEHHRSNVLYLVVFTAVIEAGEPGLNVRQRREGWDRAVRFIGSLPTAAPQLNPMSSWRSLIFLAGIAHQFGDYEYRDRLRLAVENPSCDNSPWATQPAAAKRVADSVAESARQRDVQYLIHATNLATQEINGTTTAALDAAEINGRPPSAILYGALGGISLPYLKGTVTDILWRRGMISDRIKAGVNTLPHRSHMIYFDK